MSLLILLRHGQSMWNKANVFTGWVDVPLSRQGVDEALAASVVLREVPIHRVFTSTLMRAQQTGMLALIGHSSGQVPILDHPAEGDHAEWHTIHGEKGRTSVLRVSAHWQLNERMYGHLQGLDKDETRALHGAEQVHLWRRSHDVPPPEGESLEMTAARTLPFFREHIMPELAAGRNVLVPAHGNSLRSIIQEIEGLSPQELLDLEVPIGVPLFFTYDEGAFTRTETP